MCPKQGFFLFLDERAACATPGGHAVAAATALDAKFSAHVIALHHLVDESPMTEVLEAVPGAALQSH